METMTAMQAIEALRQGEKVTREAWPEGSWVQMRSELAAVLYVQQGATATTPITPETEWRELPWDPSLNDILSDDWAIIESS